MFVNAYEQLPAKNKYISYLAFCHITFFQQMKKTYPPFLMVIIFFRFFKIL